MTKKQISAWAREMAARRKTFAGGRPKVHRPCPLCGAELGARELREHPCLGKRGKILKNA
jgi:hypothetical protein